MEEWRDVVGFEGIYQVSNQGRVRSVDRIDSAGKRQRGKLKRTKTNNRGYHQVHLYKNNIVNYLLLHRLVAAAFIENPSELPQVNHIDEDKDNNRADNLEWCDNMYNRHHGTGIQRMAQNRDYHAIGEKTAAKLSSGRVDQLSLDGKHIKSHRSAAAAGKSIGKGHRQILACCRGKASHAYGYKWVYSLGTRKEMTARL